MSSRSEREWAMAMQAIQGLGPAIKNMQQERMAKELLGEDFSTYKLRTSVEDDKLERELRRAQIQKALRGPEADPYKAMEYDLKKRNVESLIESRKQTGGQRDPVVQFNKDLEQNYGITAEDIDNLDVESLDFHDATGKPVDQEFAHANPKDTMVVGKAGPKVLRVPYSDWTKLATRYQNLPTQAAQRAEGAEPNATPYAEQVKPQVAAKAKPLDPDTAKSILAEAGGDKEKARELARQRGYSF